MDIAQEATIEDDIKAFVVVWERLGLMLFLYEIPIMPLGYRAYEFQR